MTATLESAGFELRVVLEGEGVGQVFEVPGPGEIDCPGSCSATYPDGTAVTLDFSAGSSLCKRSAKASIALLTALHYDQGTDQGACRMFAMKSRIVFLCSSVVLLVQAIPAIAESRSASDWEFQVTPYLWAAGLDGRVSHDGLPIELRPNASFGDVWSFLDIGGMLRFEASKGRWGLVSDFIYVELSDRERFLFGTAEADLDTDVFSAMLAGTFRLVGEGRQSHLDVLFGVRYWELGAEIAFGIADEVEIPSDLALPRQYRVKESGSSPEPVLGLKGHYALSRDFYLGGWAMLGGDFGQSVLTQDYMAFLGYSFSDHASLQLGYRRLEIDFDSSGLQLDTTMHGPTIGLDWRF
ncbi:hypothetical protein [Wenzhouxiangella limi]|uniref:Uncharacterized protein n=1 Tax=Wenzhouxiangella limi TaxID=2707351 RepID=A0A845UUJ9_9GAMM|nr:hypothetical protein [Wenzhouxiangella limi]NDY95503.1 hypothetical protein [Wenzhouxiangella limi]